MHDSGSRVIRVFISSTFRDMQLERDELVKRVFPRVRRMCEQRGVAWGEVDLRWGVTDEQKAEGAVLPICLAEIERTRPYFIGLLGQRYGWVPDELPAGLVDELGWLAGGTGRSVTELEILHGVLNDPDAEGHAFFYLRDPQWIETLAPEERDDHVDPSPEAAARLDALRSRVRGSGHPCRDYADPVALGALVLADLTALVERLYPDPAPPDPLDRARAAHASFAASRFTGFVERPALTDALNRHAAADGPPLLVTGPSGIGASAVVAGWAAAWRADHPDHVVIEHYVEADADAADHRALAARLIGELARGTGRPAPTGVADDPAALRSAIHQALAGVDRRTVVVLDGVDRLDDVDGAPDLRWLPRDAPAAVRVVLTASGERPRQAVEHRGWPVLEVPPLDTGERRLLIDRFLASYSKALGDDLAARLAESPYTGNPRYLRTVLDELRQHGDHFTLGDRIDRLCSAATVEVLFEQVLARYELDYERDRSGLVGDAFSALWAARRGLTEAELLDVLGGDLGGSISPLPQAVWAPLHLAAEQGLVSRAGLLGFASADLRRAVEDRYLAGVEARSAAHATLAAYFAGRPLGERVVDELGWQQLGAGDLGALAATLADFDFTELAHQRAAADLRRLWARAEAGGHSMVAAYAAVLADPAAFDAQDDGGDRQLVWAVARLLSDAGHPAEATSLHHYLVEGARRSPAGRDEPAGGDARLRAALINLGAALWTQGALEAAETPLAEAVERCRNAGDRAMLAAALGDLAMVRRDRNDLDAAEHLFTEEERLCRDLGDEFGLQASLGNHAQLLRQLGRYDAALDLLRERERICRDLADPIGVSRASAGQAAVLADRGDVAEALDLTARHVESCRAEGDVRGLAEGLLNLSVMQSQLGFGAESAAAAAEAEGLTRRLADPGLLARVLVARTMSIAAAGQWAEAERVAREAELTARQAGAMAQVALALGVIGTARREQGDLAGAGAAHADELVVAEAAGDPQAVAVARTNLGNVAVAEQRLDAALALYGEAEPTFRRLQALSTLLPLLANRAQVHQALDHMPEALADFADAAATAATLGNHAAARQSAELGVQLAYQLGDTARAESLWASLAIAARDGGDEATLQRALGERALLLINRAQPVGVAGSPANVDHSLLDDAAVLLDEQEAICRRTGDAVGLAACVGNLAIVLRYRGDLAGSLDCLDEQLDLARRSGDAQGVLFATANRGEVLGLLGRLPEALHALNEARATAAQYDIAAMVQQLDAMIAALHSPT